MGRVYLWWVECTYAGGVYLWWVDTYGGWSVLVGGIDLF